MAKTERNTVNTEKSDFPCEMEVSCRYKIGQKLYLEDPEEKIIIECEVAEIKLNTQNGTPQTMYGVITADLDNPMKYITESDIATYHVKNTELLNEMRGQLAASLYTDGKRYATVELDNGRHISINEIKDENGTFMDHFKVSLYASSAEIQKGIFKKNGHVIEQYHGPDNVTFLYTALKNILEINSQMKTPNHTDKNKQQDNPKNFENAFSYVVKKEPGSSNMVITNAAGESLKLNIMEFWEVVKAGNHRDIRNEIDEILFESDYIEELPGYLLEGNERALNMVAQKVKDIRTGHENSDQIYEAFHKLKQELRDMLHKDILHVIDRLIDFEETYSDIPGYELRSSDAAKEIIAEYIFHHDLEPRDRLSEYIYQAIEECQDVLKAAIAKNKTESLEEKIKGTGNGTEKFTGKHHNKTVENSLER